MKKFHFFFAMFITMNSFGQTDRKISSFLSFQVNKTLYDRTITNNAAGVGFGLQTTLNTKTFIKPTLELNADLFGGTKELRTTLDGKPIYAKDGVVSIYIGPSAELTERLFIATTLGTSFYNSKMYFGLRPSIGFYPSKRKNWTAKTSFTNIFQQDEFGNKSFGYISFALAIKLF